MKRTQIALLVSSIILWIIVGIAAIFVLPVFGALFDEFGPKLPSVTRGCLALSSTVRSSPMIFTASFYGLLALFSAFVAAKKKKVYTLTFFLGGALAVSVFGVALLLPIIQLGSAG
jgi:type II secretory pathway component PulF